MLLLQDKLNRPLHDLRISVIDRCNFRCPYCMPEEKYSKHYTFLKEKEWLSFDEIIHLVQLFAKVGVRKIRLTGGEPLLRPNLDDLISDLVKIPGIEDIALTTNGALLSAYAQALKEAGLKRLAVSLDSLNPEIFKFLSGQKGNVNTVLDGIKAAEKAGFESIKINVVVQKGINDQSIIDLVKYFRGTPHILRFIEYMDVGNCNSWKLESVVPSKDILRMINEQFPLIAVKANYYGEVAKRYRFLDGKGEIGFISSVTQSFCGDCTRARISTDGKIYTCLFGREGQDLKTPLREGVGDQTLFEIIKRVWQKREDRYSELRSQIHSTDSTPAKVEMFQIGG